jgi:O-antigen/teichoic acid export membrane protein
MSHRRQAIALIGASAIGQLVMAAAYAVTARDAGPAAFGGVAIAIGWGLTIGSVSDLGVGSYCVREFAAGRMPMEEAVERLVARCCAVGLAVVVVLGAALWLRSSYVALAALLALATVVEQSVQTPLRALALSDRVAISSVIDRLALGACFSLLAWPLHVSPQLALGVSVCVGPACGAVAACGFIPRSRRRLRFKAVNPWRGAGGFGAFQLALAVQSLDMPVVGLIGGPSAAGLYGAVNRWVTPTTMTADAFSSAALPFFSRSSSLAEAWSSVRRSTWLLWIAATGTVALAIAAYPLTILVLGSGYRDAGGVLMLMCAGALLVLINQPVATFLLSQGHDRSVASIVVLCVAIQMLVVCASARNLGGISGGLGYFVFQIGLVALVLRRFRSDGTRI